jgi:hypothetical protein
MQIFVNRADLTAPADKVLVLAIYNDDPTMPYTAHGDPTVVTVLYLPNEAIVREVTELPGGIKIPSTYLAADWRLNAEQIVNEEAGRRIEDVFPDYKQQNSTAGYQQCLTAYGNDPSVWPPEAKTFKDEYDRGWAYINAVRERTPVLIATLPPDPTADSHWPTRIDPVSFQPIF